MGLKIAVVDPKGKQIEELTLPKELFGIPLNKQLLAQAVRIYLANQREGSASTKTRGEIEGSTRKIYKQKGTGRARHGAIRAPIFVGGGIVFGPKPRDYRLHFPKKMKQKALAVALSQKFSKGEIRVVDGWETMEPKTKLFAASLHDIGVPTVGHGKTLIVTESFKNPVNRAVRNIASVDVYPFFSLNTYDVLFHTTLILTKEAVFSMSQKGEKAV